MTQPAVAGCWATGLPATKGLMELDLVERRLLGAIQGPDPAEIAAVATAGVDQTFAIHWSSQRFNMADSGALRP